MNAFTNFVCKTSVALAALCLVPAVSSVAGAAVLNVANNGVDSTICGSKTDEVDPILRTKIANTVNAKCHAILARTRI